MKKEMARVPQFVAAFLAILVTHAFAADIQPIAPPELAARVPRTSMGITQLPNERIDWLLDAKFGMFIHWGLYSGVGRGEWVMQNEGILPEDYRQYAYPMAVEHTLTLPIITRRHGPGSPRTRA